MGLAEFTIAQIKAKGWMAVANLYFDNACNLSVLHSRGYVAIDETTKLCLFYSIEDTYNTANIEKRYLVIEDDKLGQQQNIVFEDLECLQHTDFAQFAHYRNYVDSETTLPTPVIPTPETILSYVKNPDTGLYTTAGGEPLDAALTDDGKLQSVIHLYPETVEGYAGKFPRSAVSIEWWQIFYKNQAKFKAKMAEVYGLTTLI